MMRLTYFSGGKWRIQLGHTEYSGEKVDQIALYENIMSKCDLSVMTSLIDAAPLDNLPDEPYKGVLHRVLMQAPVADVAPVVHGRWVKRGCKWQCTHCKVLMSIEGTPKENLLNYCPNCGAKMRCDNEQE